MSDNNDNNTASNDNSDNRWITVAEASTESGISIRTLQRKIKSGTLISKIERGRRVILASSLAELAKSVAVVGAVAELPVDNVIKENEQLKNQINDLEEELRQQRQQNDTHRQEVAKLAEEIERKEEDLRQERERSDKAKERSDMIIMQLTRNLSDAQKVLEAHTRPWWRRLRLGRGKEENKQ